MPYRQPYPLAQSSERKRKPEYITSAVATQKPEDHPQGWLAALPTALVTVDVKTTGLLPEDRVVTLAAIRLDTSGLAAARFEFDFTHLIFNPGRRSHPNAAEVHGYPDSLLRQQEYFAVYARMLAKFIDSGDLIVAHNAAFDLAAINRELAIAGVDHLSRPVFCTLEAYRAVVGATGGASLGSIAGRLGLHRQGSYHDAMEDAWFAMMIFLWLHDCPYQSAFPSHRPDVGLVNLRNPQPEP